MNPFMMVALNEAKKGVQKGHGGPFGSVIVKDGEIVARAHNKVIYSNDPTCHGEMEAIRKACLKLRTFDLSGCELYTTSEPCPMCKGAIKWANIEKVYYGCTVEDAENIGFRDKVFESDDCLVMESVNRDECLQLFSLYSSSKEKVLY